MEMLILLIHLGALVALTFCLIDTLELMQYSLGFFMNIIFLFNLNFLVSLVKQWWKTYIKEDNHYPQWMLYTISSHPRRSTAHILFHHSRQSCC